MRLFSGFRFYFESLLATKWCVELWSVATLAVIYAKVHTDALQPATIIMGKCQMQYIGSYILHMYKRGAGLPHSQFYVRMCIGSVAEQEGLFTIFVVSALVISKFILCATRKKFLLMHKLWGCFFHNEMSTENLLIGKKNVQNWARVHKIWVTAKPNWATRNGSTDLLGFEKTNFIKLPLNWSKGEKIGRIQVRIHFVLDQYFGWTN